MYISYGFGFWLALAILIAAVLTTLLGVAIERFLYAPLWKSGASQEAVLLSSLGFYIVTANIVAVFAGNENLTINRAIGQPFEILELRMTTIQWVQVTVALLLLVGLHTALRFTKIGLILRAIIENPELSVIHGLRLERIRIAVLAIGSLMAGVAGSLAAMDTGVAPHIGLRPMLEASICCLAVGSTSIWIQVATAITLAVLQGLTGWWLGVAWSSAATFSVVVLVFLWHRTRRSD